MLSFVRASRCSLNQFSRRQFHATQARTFLALKDVKYKVTATATGAGRKGKVEANGFSLSMDTPSELGGTGKGQNPEQLYAMGYASCFLAATQLAARTQKKNDQAQAAKVHVSVSLGEPKDIGGFGLAVDIKAEGVDEEVLRAAHKMCPYSRALNHGVSVNVSKA
ncbi:hypothetical protein AGABI1DRAFT_116308 [Agaricus bisporus var. burnettii JB137-S8]|uniref:OsmC-like protein n=1 Tax=Agaricus bisporus var. burnettii (strain JB137-S8 / ATCC MYA-4627 / FGSC 10392) TaxID=597362 RepID=K5VMG0_AGABU|nr:uncharacterized protein AGABI1DRAFT_116308 [Agaricus bisporus var. burnettii JB137-S8]EKM75589.1 hypothetical protein AGABI1DRAFT_116308 [Agaricus bisporus var. burnettii JB137-S8]